MSYYVGIDLGGTNIVAGVVDKNYNIIAKAKCKTNSERGFEAIVNDMSHLAVEAVERAKLTMEDIAWVGVGAPGTINQDTGVVEYSNNLDWYDVPLKAMMQERLQKEVHMDNDANAAAYGEYVAGSAKDADIAIMVTLGTGVGGGVVIGNKVYTGFNFAGAELGHSVIIKDGRQCTCGRKGCLETYASATGLITTTKEAMDADKSSIMWEMIKEEGGHISGKTAFMASDKGDKAGKVAVDKYISDLACGITNIINIFQPNILCIGGGVSHEGDALFQPLKAIVEKEVYSRNSKNNTEIVLATLGGDAGLIGAALLGNQGE